MVADAFSLATDFTFKSKIDARPYDLCLFDVEHGILLSGKSRRYHPAILRLITSLAHSFFEQTNCRLLPVQIETFSVVSSCPPKYSPQTGQGSQKYPNALAYSLCAQRNFI
jgi:hypothetical protein